MSVTIMGYVKKIDMPELKTESGEAVSDSSCKFVLMMYADAANDYGEGAYPGIRALVRMTQLSTETVTRAVNALRFNEFLIPDGVSKLRTNSYKINLEKLTVLMSRTVKGGPDSNEQNGSVLIIRTNPLVVVNIPDIYEKEIGALTPLIADEIQDAEKTYPLDWIAEAIKVAASQNKRSWSYVKGVLKRMGEKKSKNPTPPSPSGRSGKSRRLPQFGPDGRIIPNAG